MNSISIKTVNTSHKRLNEMHNTHSHNAYLQNKYYNCLFYLMRRFSKQKRSVERKRTIIAFGELNIYIISKVK